jgi:hypothetical protein
MEVGNHDGPVAVGIHEDAPEGAHEGAAEGTHDDQLSGVEGSSGVDGGAEQAPAGSEQAVTVKSTVAQTDTVLVAIPGITGRLAGALGTTPGVKLGITPGTKGTLVGGVAAAAGTTIGAPLVGFHRVVAEGVGCQLGLLGKGEAMSQAETTVAASAAAEID